MRFPHIVAVKRAPLVADGKGNQIRDWTTATTSSSPYAYVQPVSSDENDLNQDRIVSRWRIFLPSAADVLATDRIVFDGETYQIDGEVQTWDTGRPHHAEAYLKKVAGG